MAKPRGTMVLVGRALSLGGLVAILIGLLLAAWGAGSLMDLPGPRLAFSVLGVLTPLSAFGAWGLGIYHWSTSRPSGSKRLWGIIVSLGAFIGSALYWWIGTRHLARPGHLD